MILTETTTDKKPSKLVVNMIAMSEVITTLHYLGLDNIRITYNKVEIYVPFKNISNYERGIKDYWVESAKEFKMFGRTIKFLSQELL
jgi:hypothetical protein